MSNVGGVPGAALRILGNNAAGLVLGTGFFRPNGVSAITVKAGSLAKNFTVTYGAVGLYTVAFIPTGFKFPAARPPVILPFATCADRTATHWFQVAQLGAYNNTTRSFQLEAHQGVTAGAAVAFAPPSDVSNWIGFLLLGESK